MGKALKALGIAGLILLNSSLANAESKLGNFLKKLEFGASYGLQMNANNPAEDYIDGVNKDFRDGKYLFSNPIPQWRDIKVSNPNEFPIEAEILYKTGLPKNIRIGLVGAISNTKAESNYNENYDIYDEYSGLTIPDNFNRKETINTKSNSIGIKAKADLLKWLSVSLTGKSDFYEVKGNVDYTLHRLDLDLKQWRKAEYSGSGTSSSLEAGLDFNITKNISVGLVYGSRGSEVKTSGKQVISQSSTPEWSTTRDYSPKFNFSSTYASGNIKLRF